jgi:hypothetical protein
MPKVAAKPTSHAEADESDKRSQSQDEKMFPNRLRETEIRTAFATLTPREREFLEQIVAGKPTKEIASDIGISERTIKALRVKIIEKLKVYSGATRVKLIVPTKKKTADDLPEKMTEVVKAHNEALKFRDRLMQGEELLEIAVETKGVTENESQARLRDGMELVILDRAIKIRRMISDLERELAALEPVRKSRVILPELHDRKSGRIDARKVADFMGVPLKRLAEGLGLPYNGVHRNPSAAGYQKALQPVKRSLEILHEFFGPKETIRVWLNTPHAYLEGATALATILEGKAFAVDRLLGCAWEGVPA